MTLAELNALNIGDRILVLESCAGWDAYRGIGTIADVYAGEALVMLERTPGCGVWFTLQRLALAPEQAQKASAAR